MPTCPHFHCWILTQAYILKLLNSPSPFLNCPLQSSIYLFMTALGLHCLIRPFSSCAEWGLFSSYGAWASHCGGFCGGGAWALGQAGFSRCGSWAYLPCSTRNLPRPGIEPVSLALASKFFTTRPSGKYLCILFVPLSWDIDGETVETVSDFYFLGLQNHCRWWLQPWN